MSKYDELKETPQELTTITGQLWTKEYLEFTHTKDSLCISIRGFPPCPECGNTLERKFMAEASEPDWRCSCGTTYDTPTLVKILFGGISNGV